MELYSFFFINYLYIFFFLQVWAVSGVQRESSGGKRGSILLKWATLGVTPQTLPMKKCALVSPRFILKFNQIVN